ncbi:phosphoadenosine phosphosulfate reductase [Serratia phage Parlo]|uniref:Phosphoadenosine phosphosulfate reductase n=1 Tax=Serratia phage Parlo TaxID=2557554 RepID=A0A482MG66_9CAUD|nr:phosphoadenosine phosphosulfate reductase [Serratia phage Parlo]QBQ72172.1 phosphoadenosine phosphosulfate reductase [Serratia phage Parlo]
MQKNYNVVSNSSGKDSTATLLLAVEEQAENIKSVFADTGNELPQVYDYLDYLESKVGIRIQRIRADFSHRIENKKNVVQTKWRKEGVSEAIIEQALAVLVPSGNPYLDLCLWKGRFPSRMAQFCTDELKRNPVIEQVFMPLLDDPDTGDVWSWQGIRADESKKRAGYAKIEEVGAGLFNYRPILTWTAQDVFDFHRKHGVKWNPLYEMGMDRVGCAPCINVSKNELHELARRFPEQIDRIAEWERLVSLASKHQGASFFGPTVMPVDIKGMTNQEAMSKLNVHEVVKWSKTTRGGRHFDMMKLLPVPSGCSSSYGLCDTPVRDNGEVIFKQSI